MGRCQATPTLDEKLDLRSERLGPLPLINHFLDRLGLEEILERFVPTPSRRTKLPYAKGIGVLVRSLLVDREPIYRQHETVSAFAESAFGLGPDLVDFVRDDAIGRALDRLFEADRAALVTEVVIAAVQRFGLVLDELHNDSTTVSFCGQYRSAGGRTLRGRRAPFITYGYSKNHRPDLKQLLFILTTSEDGGVPVQFRCDAGNASDSRSHEETWEALRRAAGRTDFLYVADCKLCSQEPMDYIDSRGGRFVTVMPRSRSEDRQFRRWIQDHTPDWELVWNRPNPRRKSGPRDRWWVYRAPVPSREAWPITWLYSSLLKLRQSHRRQENLTAAIEELTTFNARLLGPRPRVRARPEIEQQVARILLRNRVTRYLEVELVRREEHNFRQTRPGRPGPETKYVRKTRRRWALKWKLNEQAIAYDRKSDGMYPLLTNDRRLTPAQVLEAHKRQPTIEKRFEQTKTVFEIAPVMLKNEGRIEALFFTYFLALLVQALIERELRGAMEREEIASLPLYPEDRRAARPTAEQIFRLFSLAERHVLHLQGQDLRVFELQLTELQEQVLTLLGVPVTAYQSRVK